MIRYLAILAGVALIGANPVSAGAQTIGDQPIVKRGTAMFWYDRAAWVTTDDMRARLDPARGPEVGGWIVVPAGTGYHVYYHGQGPFADRIVYEADVLGNAVSNARIWPRDKAPRLPSEASAMARALRIARKAIAARAEWRPCANAMFNTIVMPPAADGSVDVYFLTPQTEAGSVPFGGHYKLVVSAAGTVVESRPFTRACLEMDSRQSAPVGTEALSLSHMLDPQPTEIHVFQQYAIGMPLFVLTTANNLVWKVDNGTVVIVDMPERPGERGK